MEPIRPLVGDIFIQEAVLGSHVRQEALHLRRHVVLDEPELDPVPAQYIANDSLWFTRSLIATQLQLSLSISKL